MAPGGLGASPWPSDASREAQDHGESSRAAPRPSVHRSPGPATRRGSDVTRAGAGARPRASDLSHGEPAVDSGQGTLRPDSARSVRPMIPGFPTASLIEVAWTLMALPGLGLSIYNANGA